jgi:hypothetical protein
LPVELLLLTIAAVPEALRDVLALAVPRTLEGLVILSEDKLEIGVVLAAAADAAISVSSSSDISLQVLPDRTVGSLTFAVLDSIVL